MIGSFRATKVRHAELVLASYTITKPPHAEFILSLSQYLVIVNSIVMQNLFWHLCHMLNKINLKPTLVMLSLVNTAYL